MKRCKVAAALWFCLGLAPAPSWPADTAVAAAPTARGETIIVRITLNTESKGDFFVERMPDRDFLVKREDLKTMGFRDPPGTEVMVDGEPYLSLRSMPGVGFDFLESELALNVTAPAQLLSAQAFTVEKQARRTAHVPVGTSLFANYALNWTRDRTGSSRPGFAGELGWRSGDYLFLTDGSTVADDLSGQRKFVRLMSSVTHDDRAALRRTVVGDFSTPAREFSNGTTLGGISISKLYGLDPYFIQFPMQSVSGNVALPSELEVYVDGQRVRTERLKPGEFELRDILAYGGARNVQLLLRDAFGRVQQLSYSFYFSDQPLSQGLHEYSYNLGAIRRSYGEQSNRYGPAAFSMFHRYGWSNAVTLGMRAEAGKNLLNAGPTATVVLGSAGIASLAFSGSSLAGQHGSAGLASYTYQARNWGLGVSLRRDWNRYAALGDPITVTNRKYEASVSASYHVENRGVVSLTHSLFAARSGFSTSGPSSAQPFAVVALGNRRVSTLGYSVPLVPGRAALTASVSHIKDQPRGSRNEAFVGLNIFLDRNYSVAASFRGDQRSNSESLQLIKQQPIGEGLGFIMAADRSADPAAQDLRLKSSLQYNAPAAIFRAELDHARNQGITSDDYRVSVAGGIGYVDGLLALGRPITGSFGIVKVAQLPGVGVLVNGQRIGETDGQGQIFLPTLSPYMDNDVSIATETLPIEYSIASISRKISPSLRSGTVVEFAATKLHAFSGKLKARNTDGLSPVEFQEISLGGDANSRGFYTGHGGEFYIENLKAGKYAATVMVQGKPCPFDLVIPELDETFVELGDIVCRPRP